MDYIDESEQIDMKTLAAISTAAAMGGIGTMKATSGNIGTRAKYIDYMRNYLPGFYSNKFGSKALASGKEAIAGNISIMKNIVNPNISYTHDVTGLSPRAYEQLLGQEEQLNFLRNESNKLLEFDPELKVKGNTAIYEKSKRQIAHIQKQQHYKLVNDYSNRFLFNNKGLTATDDVARYAQNFVSKIDNPVEAQKYFGGDKDAMRWITKGQGIKNQRHALYLLHKNPPKTGDVLRGIQFDNRVYNTFGNMNEIGGEKFSNLTPKKMESVLKKSGLSWKEINGKYFFKVSPRMKANYDWGGYQGIVEWNPKKRDKVKFYANDKRDLFKMKFGGRDVINVVQPKEISIPEAEAIISDELAPKKQKELVEKITRRKRAPKITKMAAKIYSPGNNIAYAKEVTAITQAQKEILTKKIPIKNIVRFMAKRFGFGLASAGISGLAVLALIGTIQMIKDRGEQGQ